MYYGEIYSNHIRGELRIEDVKCWENTEQGEEIETTNNGDGLTFL